jgi:HEAT repeat protein
MLWWTLKQLQSEDAIKRIEAIRRLRGVHEPRAIEALIERLDDPADPVVQEAGKALAQAGGAATEKLRAALNHPSDKCRIHAASILRMTLPHEQSGHCIREAVDVLISAMNHPDPALRRLAAGELGETGETRAIKCLAAGLCDKDAEVRGAVRGALLKIHGGGPDEAGRTGAAHPDPPVASLLEALPLMVDALRLHPPGEREHEIAGKLLAWLGGAAIPHLLELMRQAPRDFLRANVVDALGYIQDPSAQKALIDALKDRAASVRVVAAHALGKLRSASAGDALVAALKDAEVNVRLAAAESLLESTPAGRATVVIPPLLQALRNESAQARRRAAVLLGRIGDLRAAGDLITSLRDKEEEVRKAAEEALTRFGSAVEGHLIKALKDKAPEIRRAAACILGRIGSLQAVEPLLGALQDPDEWVRAHAAEILRKVGDQRAILPFTRALRDSNPIVRTHAAAVLGELGDQQVVRPLLRAAREIQPAPEFLGALIAIMAMHGMNVDPEDLRTMAEFTSRTSKPAVPRAPAATSEEEMNLSALRQLAREELSRRGLRLPT